MVPSSPLLVPLVLALVGLAGAPVVLAATSASIEIEDGAEELRAALEALPFVSRGEGPPLYILQFSTCPHSKQFFRDFRGKPPGVEARHVFYAVSQKTANETAWQAMKRSNKDYGDIMKGRLRAPKYDRNDESIAAFNSVMGPVNEVILPTLSKNGWPSKSLISPTLFWEKDGRLYVDGGYSKDRLETILASARVAEPEPGSEGAAARKAQQSGEETKPAVQQAAASTPPAAPTPGKQYSQVNLPTEVMIGLKTTEVQGIRYGMPFDKVEAIAKGQGYQGEYGSFKLDDGQSLKILGVTGSDLVIPGEEGIRVSVISYQQKFRPEIKFDAEAVKQSLIRKYGKPADDYGMRLRYYPERPSYDVEKACMAEMQKKEDFPSYAFGMRNPMLLPVWQKRGERDVIEKCPGQLEGFRQLMHSKLGVYAEMTINAATKELSIVIRDQGVGNRNMRRAGEERLQKADSGAAAQVDL